LVLFGVIYSLYTQVQTTGGRECLLRAGKWLCWFTQWGCMRGTIIYSYLSIGHAFLHLLGHLLFDLFGGRADDFDALLELLDVGHLFVRTFLVEMMRFLMKVRSRFSLISATFFMARSVTAIFSRSYFTGLLRFFSNSNVLSMTSSLPRNLRNALVHAVLRGFFFILKFLWHFDRQKRKHCPSLRTNIVPCPGYTVDEQNQHFSRRMVPRLACAAA